MLDLIEAIYAAIDKPSQWRTVPRIIADALGATAYSIALYSPGELRSKRIASWGLDLEILAEYDARWALRDPWRHRTIAHMFTSEAEQNLSAVHMGSLVPPAEMRELPIFLESFSRLDIYDGLLLPLAAQDSFMWITLFCGSGKELFSEREIELANRIAPHLLRASRLVEERSYANRHLRNGKLADFGAPALILDRRGDVVESNTSFKETIGAREGGRFRLGDKAVSSALNKFLGASDADCAYESVIVETKTDWRLRFHRFDSLKDLIGDGGRADICLVIFERDQDAANAATSLKQRFDLTETESEIASLILAGRTPIQIADLRQCSVSTVRWHLRQIYSKMGVTRRSELAARVTTG